MQWAHLSGISERLTTIGNGAFSRCNGLTSVTFPEGLASIGEYAFQDATGSPQWHFQNR